jgi:hypothetical protein
VTPTVSMLSPERWLPPTTLDIPDLLNLRRWLPSLVTVLFGCGVAPMWPGQFAGKVPNGRARDDSQAGASAMRSRRPSIVLEMLWSAEPTWISVCTEGAAAPKTFLLGQKRHDGGSQREISVDIEHVGPGRESHRWIWMRAS